MDKTNLVSALTDRMDAPAPGAGPLYLRLATALKSLVVSGEIKPGAALPPERELAEALDLGRVTIRNAYRDLIGAGVLQTRQGSGTFVAGNQQRIEQPLWRLTSFSSDMQSRGKVPAARVLSQAVEAASPEEAFRLGLGADLRVLKLSRLRLADERPLAIERAVVPIAFLPEEFDASTSLYAALEKEGKKPVHALQRLTAVTLEKSLAELLEVPSGAPALLIERMSRLKDQRIVEYTKSYYRGDAYDFVAELKIGETV